MHIDPIARSAQLSVRELAAFRNIPESSGFGYSSWRAAVGQQWHKTSEEQTRITEPDAQFEVSIKAQWRHRDWTIHLQGRIDQLLPRPSGLCIREVKTVRAALPMDTDELLARYPDYLAQVAIYLRLASVLPEYEGQSLSAELQFIDIENGAIQAISVTEDAAALFEQQLETLTPFLDDRRAYRVRLNKATIRPAFTTLREGQAELITTLETASLQSKTILLEAPTGFGKTGIVLEHALKQLKSGVFERFIYLTSKSTGQIETIRQLQAMIGDDIRYIQMRNRKEHFIDSVAHTCTGDQQCNDHLGQRWVESGISPPELFSKGTVSLDRARELGAETGICPYAITKACLPFAEAWIGDTNYVFAPSSQSVFTETLGFDSAKILLIIDEAHNLPDRVADALSVEVGSGELTFALEELRAAGATRRLVSIGSELARCIDRQAAGNGLSANTMYELLDLCEDFTRQLQDARFDYEQCAHFALEIIWRIPDLAHRLAEPSHEWLHWLPKAGVLRATCLDANTWIAKCLQPFGGALLMSATISPVDTFRERCGLNRDQITAAIGHAPWREHAYNVAIDTRVNTRYTQRERYYELTARTIITLSLNSLGVPVAVFFASYQYAENIRAYVEAMDASMRVMLQPRGVDLTEQETFIDEGLLMADALFLILGSSYAEGVDKLGGRIDSVMIVGPALPEVNAVQQAKMDAHPSLSREENFRDVYLLPAMCRIHQALGRIVRAPGQKARVLLHGKRFAETAYKTALADEYQDAIELKNDDELNRWLVEE